jgi:hypothetical protein
MPDADAVGLPERRNPAHATSWGAASGFQGLRRRTQSVSIKATLNSQNRSRHGVLQGLKNP